MPALGVGHTTRCMQKVVGDTTLTISGHALRRLASALLHTARAKSPACAQPCPCQLAVCMQRTPFQGTGWSQLLLNPKP